MTSAPAAACRPLLAAALAIGLGAACAAPNAHEGRLVPLDALVQPLRAQQKIVNGDLDVGDQAVGLLTIYPAGGAGSLHTECSATLVGSQLILTAAHCLIAHDGEGRQQDFLADAANVSFHLGSSLPGGMAAEDADNFQATALYLPGGADFDLTTFTANIRAGRTNDNDLALVGLDHPAVVQPLAVLVAPLVPSSIGAPLEVVGYGSRGTAGISGDGSRQSTSLAVLSYTDHAFVAGSPGTGTCSGDSGGPALWGNTIVGLTQAGHVDNGACVGSTYFTRLDPFAAFLVGP